METSKKVTAGTNKSGAHGPTKNLAKLENETEVFEHERVSTELKKQIQSARLAKKLTQAQLAQIINEKPQIINEYESGKAIPNPQVSLAAGSQRHTARRVDACDCFYARWESISDPSSPVPQILGKLSRALGVTLKKNPGKK